MGQNWKLCSKALQNVCRRRLSEIEMSHYIGFHFDLMYIFGLARGIRSLMRAKNTPNMKVSLKSPHAFVNVKCRADRGGEIFNLKA